MNDDIDLPPLPPKPPVTDPDAAMQAYGRACYKAGVVIGERRAKVDAKPGVRSVKIELCKDGTIYANNVNPTGGSLVVSAVTLSWTADGSAWIES